MQVTRELENCLIQANMKSNYDIIMRFYNSIEDYVNSENVDEQIAKKISQLLEPVRKWHDELEILASLPIEKVDLENIKSKIMNFNLEELYRIQQIIDNQNTKIDNEKKENERKVMNFIKKSIEEIGNRVAVCKNSLKVKNEELASKNEENKEKLEELIERRNEVEAIPTTSTLVVKEKKMSRFLRIMKENPELWTEIEVGDTIYLKNSKGEIRGEVKKQYYFDEEDIVKTEKAVFNARKKYNLFKKIKDLRKCKVFTIDPIEREKLLNETYFDIALLNSEIAENKKNIQCNERGIERISEKYEDFARKVEKIIDGYKDNDEVNVMDIMAELTEMIGDMRDYLNNYEFIKAEPSNIFEPADKQFKIPRIIEEIGRV